jgi:phosphotriesterase-related protein
MPTVETLNGPIDTALLGVTLTHEHVVLLDAETEVNRLGRWRAEIEIPRATADLIRTKAAGVGTLVDLTAIGMGRDVRRVARIADGTGLNVVVATGVYTFDQLPAWFRARGPGTANGGPDPLEAVFVDEIENGIAGTSVRAGVIKCTTHTAGITADIDRLLRAAARAHRRTGVPISTHTDAVSRRGLDQQRVFREEGVDLRRVVIGHCGDSTDLDYLTALLDEGSFIGLDRFGYDLTVAPEQRVEMVLRLIDMGYVDQLLLSQDAPCYSDGLEPETRARLWPHCSHRFVVEQVVPALLERGVGQADIDRMLIHNPAAILGRGSAY